MFKPILLLLSIPSTLAAIISYDWNIGFVSAAPDGVSRQVIGINGQWPLPVIEGTAGDTVTINITNSLGNQSTGLHFHGINQKGTPFMDGPSAVSQCPVPPGSSFTYTFQLDEPGTYWYHSHSNGQYPDGLRGPLIVHDPNDPYAGQYDEEIILTTSDWYHDEVGTLIQQLLNTSNTGFNPPIPDSLLLNDTQAAKFHFTPGKTYKVRIISMAAFASTLFQFGGHQMQIIEVDGSYTQIATADQIRVAPAQRYTVLIKALATTDLNYAFLVALDINRDFTNVSASVFPHNITGYIVYDESKAYPSFPVEVDTWAPADDVTFQSQSGQSLLASPTKEITLNFTFGIDSQGVPRSYFNNITYVAQKVPSLFTAFTTGSSNTNPLVYGTVNPFVVESGDIVQIVVNNNDAAIHPFHLHGHQFQVLERPASGSGAFDGHNIAFLGAPMQRDTVTVNANSYVVLRFQANNPGVWLFHCHIEWHVIMGLAATIIEAPESLAGGTIPSDHQSVCNAQKIPLAGNAAGNTQNFLDLAGANTQPPNPDNGPTFEPSCVNSGSCDEKRKRERRHRRSFPVLEAF
ncbi:related to Conidial Pigment Biosynthesis protein brown1 [Phialocephala subalpina]|uniref:Related to Conidial Pigment Biosynthesis protein brown1 n=1 Tax=Phialocephala subalpina TaxID=576137 RepID=A0A1L7XHT7_9HELO|nr:related to Conidial Pigment Biosynthesis protein brown1 [Phialocephala subalpina]